MNKAKKKDERTRNWTLIVYPESAPKNWREILNNGHIPWIESPCHDKDRNPDNSLKKAHWHILLMFTNKKSYLQILGVARELHSPNPQKCANVVGMVRYFAHIDNPEKYQYKPSDIVGHCGADPQQYLKSASQEKADRIRTLKDITKFIADKRIDNYIDFLMYCITDCEHEDWFEIAVDHNTLAINRALDAMWHKNNDLKFRDRNI